MPPPSPTHKIDYATEALSRLTSQYQKARPIAILPFPVMSGLAVWYRGDLGVTLNGSKVSAWADQSGSGDSNRNATQGTGAKQPAYLSADPLCNHQATIGGTNGTTTFLLTGTWSVPLVQPFTCFMVGYNTFNGQAWPWDSNLGGECSITSNGTSADRMYAGAFGGGISIPNASLAAYIGIFDTSGAGSSLRVSQATANAGGSIGTNAPSPLIIGDAQGDATGANTGWVLGELAFWTRDLSIAEVAALNAYATNRYAITIGP